MEYLHHSGSSKSSIYPISASTIFGARALIAWGDFAHLPCGTAKAQISRREENNDQEEMEAERENIHGGGSLSGKMEKIYRFGTCEDQY